ncbi:DUF4221 domain-containing protein [Belliella sp. DSM 111904]|uniref:DUF4221 domain-containing protein n=1 Tax=Belliella filtrata TaxID=2923435 RepID=A0ABS9UZC6_9BACT|nr:DUF4221 family protein [Belliella filtrata]MCH7409120.1 DUF4221 domain-containing protein [Belliella filtrata]
MKKINIKLILLKLILVCMYSCAGNQSSEPELSFKEIHTYEIHLDRFTSPVEEYFQYLSDWKGKEAYAFHVEAKGQIKLYSLETGELIESIAYAENQPNLQTGIHEFFILNEDSIFLNRRRAYKMYLINKEFDIVQTLDFFLENDEIDKNTGWPKSKEAFMPVFSRNRLFRKIEDKVYVSGAPNINAVFAEATSVKTLLNSKSLVNGETQSLLGFPEKLQGKGLGEYYGKVLMDYSYDEDFFLLSYAADEKAYLANRELNIIEEFDAFPKNYKKAPPLSSKEIENNDAYRSHYQNHHIFGSIHWDPFRKLIYRIVEEPNKNYKPGLLRDPIHRARNMTIMAFDPKQNYRKIAQLLVEKSENGTYLDRCFVNEKGFNITYVSNENEDKLYFKTYLVE